MWNFLSGRGGWVGISRDGCRLCRLIGRRWGVVVLFRESDGKVLDAVFHSKSFEEDNEFSEVLDEVVVAFVSFDVA